MQEDEYHDFKQQWYIPTDRAEMVRDIFSFVNTVHHHDCYLIIGVDDDCNVVGVENDENRLDTQKITDFLHNLPIANSSIPKVVVKTIKVENHSIDVIVIKDSLDVPVYLYKDKQFKGSKRKVHAGQIFIRENDTNTPRNESANDYVVEMLWKKRFSLDLPIRKRYMAKLEDIDNWEYLENGNKAFFLYNIDPDYCMFLEEDNMNRNKVESYSLNQIRPTLSWNKLVLKFRDRTINEFMTVFLDGVRFMSLAPNLGAINSVSSDILTFQYFVEDSLEFAVEKLFLSMKQGGISPDSFQQSNLFKNIVVFKNQTEMKKVLHSLKSKEDIIKEKCEPSKDDIKNCRLRLSMDFNNKELQSLNLKNICQEEKVSEYVINYLNDMRQNISIKD